MAEELHLLHQSTSFHLYSSYQANFHVILLEFLVELQIFCLVFWLNIVSSAQNIIIGWIYKINPEGRKKSFEWFQLSNYQVFTAQLIVDLLYEDWAPLKLNFPTDEKVEFNDLLNEGIDFEFESFRKSIPSNLLDILRCSFIKNWFTILLTIVIFCVNLVVKYIFLKKWKWRELF